MQPFLQDVIVRFMRNIISVDPLGVPSVRRVLNIGPSSTRVALTTTCKRISILAVDANIRFAIGSSSSLSATTISHLILEGERLDLKLPTTTPYIAAISNVGESVGTLEITELTN
jgi:hypothetical protein